MCETGGNLEKAQEYLRKKSLSTADKKSSRIGSYIHDSLIGVLLECYISTCYHMDLLEILALKLVTWLLDFDYTHEEQNIIKIIKVI